MFIGCIHTFLKTTEYNQFWYGCTWLYRVVSLIWPNTTVFNIAIIWLIDAYRLVVPGCTKMTVKTWFGKSHFFYQMHYNNYNKCYYILISFILSHIILIFIYKKSRYVVSMFCNRPKSENGNLTNQKHMIYVFSYWAFRFVVILESPFYF